MNRDETINFMNGYRKAASRRGFFLELLQESRAAGAGEAALAELAEKADREGETMQRILNLIGRMDPESEKKVIFYRFVKGMTYAEIAARMGYSKRQVQRLCVAGLDLLARDVKKGT